jgi:hypothetical protein
MEYAMSRGMLKLFSFLLLSLFFISACSVLQEPPKAEPDLIAVSQQELNVMQIEHNITVSKLHVKEKKDPVKMVAFKTTPMKRVSTTSQKKDHKDFSFDLIKKGFKDNNTLLVVGGIQGDEPGGFMAASLLATQYEIKKGSLWVVPNLNFYSIIKRSRGPFGDMNRKFASLQSDDPDFKAVSKIKQYITDEQVKLVVNLHDGSGYYRKKYIDKEHSPHKWGQCSIVDQEHVSCKEYGDLKAISQSVVDHVNANLIRKEDRYSYNNTKTAEGNEEMAKTLTYFAVKNTKAAFGNEASKNLPTHERVYYHLLALEKYMQTMGIVYERHFELTPSSIKEVLNRDVSLSIEGKSITLPLENIRSVLNYFPVSKDGVIAYVPSNPLLHIVKDANNYTVYYGNRRLTHLRADYVDYENSQLEVRLNVDNRETQVHFGDVVHVKKEFLVPTHEKYRVNIIGYSNASKKETDTVITRDKILKHYSVDRDAQIYRVEFYKKDKFAGTVLVRFEDT